MRAHEGSAALAAKTSEEKVSGRSYLDPSNRRKAGVYNAKIGACRHHLYRADGGSCGQSPKRRRVRSPGTQQTYAGASTRSGLSDVDRRDRPTARRSTGVGPDAARPLHRAAGQPHRQQYLQRLLTQPWQQPAKGSQKAATWRFRLCRQPTARPAPTADRITPANRLVDLFASPDYNNNVSGKDDQQSVPQAVHLLPELRPESRHGDPARSDHQVHGRGELGAAPIS